MFEKIKTALSSKSLSVQDTDKSAIMIHKIEMLDALFKHATEGIVVVGKDGSIDIVNPKAERMFGYVKDELLGKKIENLIPQRYTSTHEQHRDEYVKKPHSRSMGMGLDLLALKKDGSEFPVEISLSSFETSEGQYFMCFIIDITERRKQENEIKTFNAELERRVQERTEELAYAINKLAESKQEVMHALEAERELNELKSRFITTASHEFRTPLATVLSSVSLIGEYAKSSDQDKRLKHIGRVQSAVHNLTNILNDFLSLSKLEEGLVKNQPEEIALDEFAKDMVEEMKSILKTGQNILYTHTATENSIEVDPQLLKNVLLNLLSNAIKYSPENKEIHFTTSCMDKNVVITIKDQGIGIPKEDQPFLFDRFFRAKNAGNIQGTGLGLNIVKKYIELMNGDINYTSVMDEGSTFMITFPIKHLPS